jgi:EmrB/QacA subfamily drug resistance transporter
MEEMEEQETRSAGLGETVRPDDESATVTPRLWLGLMALALSAMMHGTDAMVVTVANPIISVEMKTGLSQLQWVTTGYLLAYAATLITAGKLGDRYGHRRVFLTGMIGFMFSSAMVGLSHSIGMLIAWRVMQGACGASLLPSALAILRLTFPANKLKVAIGVFMGTFALSAASGPFLGGLVVQYAGWRWAFFINVVGGAITFVMVTFLIRRTRPEDARRPLDLPGIGLVTVTLLTLVLGINQAPTRGWTGVLPVVCFIVAVLFGALFVLRERSAGEPLMPLTLFHSRTFVTGNLLLLLGTGLMFAVWFYLALFLQNVQGLSPLRTGIELLPIPATGIIAAPLGGVLSQKLGPRPPLMAGVALSVVGFFGLSRMSVGSGYHSIWPFLVMLGVSMSFIVPIGTEVVISTASKNLTGVASGISETMGSLGPALGVASVGTAITLSIQNGLADRLAGAGVPKATADQVRANTESIAQGTVPTPRGTPQTLAATIARQAHEAFTSGLHATLTAALVVLLLVCLPLVWLIRPAVSTQDDKTPTEAVPSQTG